MITMKILIYINTIAILLNPLKLLSQELPAIDTIYSYFDGFNNTILDLKYSKWENDVFIGHNIYVYRVINAKNNKVGGKYSLKLRENGNDVSYVFRSLSDNREIDFGRALEIESSLLLHFLFLAPESYKYRTNPLSVYCNNRVCYYIEDDKIVRFNKWLQTELVNKISRVINFQNNKALGVFPYNNQSVLVVYSFKDSLDNKYQLNVSKFSSDFLNLYWNIELGYINAIASTLKGDVLYISVTDGKQKYYLKIDLQGY